MQQSEQLRNIFANPPAAHRSAPFWAWNDELREEELVRQIQEMQQQGMGGFFIHSRDGLETEYMGPEWMNCVQTAVHTAEKLGMEAWLYDEDRWPSGFAGGRVQARGGDAFRAKGLTLEVCQRVEDLTETQPEALFRAVIDERTLLRCERIALPVSDDLQLGDGEVLLVFRVEVSVPSEWFNHEAPPDHLNPDTVQAFIDITYEAYKREVGEHFGRTVHGVFTDEPSIHDRHCRFTEGRGWIPWSESFPAFFRERRGYDLLDLLPYIYFNGTHSSQARHDYWWTVTERFSESYSGQIGAWCEANGLAFTGHYLWENNLGTATRVCGAVMPNYRFQHVPGIDMLNEQTNEYITVKQCSSVAHQYGRKFVLTETYGCTGWGFTFEGQRWMGDFQYVLGVNKRSQHLALYSIRGCRKRDYPPVFNYNTSWWKYNHIVEDYFARLSAVLSEGKPIREVLVLHPSTTAWSMVGTGPYGFPARGKDKDVSATNTFGHEFNAFLGGLLKAHYDFDLGDEIIMSETGAVRGDKLAVQLAAYRIVVIPPIRSMLRSTFRLLSEFVQAGGTIIAAGSPADMLEGRPAEAELAQLYRHPNVLLVQDVAGTIEALEQKLPRQVHVTYIDSTEEASECLMMLREIDDLRVLFVVNNDRVHAHKVRIVLKGHGSVEEWDALTGEIRAVPTELAAAGAGKFSFTAAFGPADSKLYVWHPVEVTDSRPGVLRSPKQLIAQADDVQLIEAINSFTRTMPNVLTLDTCSYRLNPDGDWSEELDVWQAQRDIRQALNMRQVYGNGLEQRYKWIHDPHPANGTPVQFRFTFYVADVPSTALHLVMEQPDVPADRMEIWLNSTAIANEPTGWFLDKSFRKMVLDGVCRGWNELIVSCKYDNRTEFEDVYLLGDFGVGAEREIMAEPNSLALGDWCGQGYLHYCGSMIYHFKWQHSHDAQQDRLAVRTVLELGSCSAVTTEVRVNGITVGHVPWQAASALEITKYLNEGLNRIDIEVMGSPRNMLGPFHHLSGEPKTTSWASFRKTGEDYTREYKVLPYGLLEPIKLYRIYEEMEDQA